MLWSLYFAKPSRLYVVYVRVLKMSPTVGPIMIDFINFGLKYVDFIAQSFDNNTNDFL